MMRLVQKAFPVDPKLEITENFYSGELKCKGGVCETDNPTWIDVLIMRGYREEEETVEEPQLSEEEETVDTQEEPVETQEESSDTKEPVSPFDFEFPPLPGEEPVEVTPVAEETPKRRRSKKDAEANNSQ
jgi:hypothetical protein